jgi:hypothetical protein
MNRLRRYINLILYARPPIRTRTASFANPARELMSALASLGKGFQGSEDKDLIVSEDHQTVRAPGSVTAGSYRNTSVSCSRQLNDEL